MKVPFVLVAALSVMMVEAGRAQTSQTRAANNGAQAGEHVSDDLKQMCRDAVRKVCNPTFPPDFEAIRRCAEDNKDKLPAQCGPLIATAGPARR